MHHSQQSAEPGKSQPPARRPDAAHIRVRPPANVAESALIAAGILAAARNTGLPEPSTVTLYNHGPHDITLLLSSDDPAETWDALETWAERYGDQEINVEPAADDGYTYAYADFPRHGTRVRVCATIKGGPGPDATAAPARSSTADTGQAPGTRT
jgi:hypothetical protein